MAWHNALYLALLLATAGYAGMRGGAPERVGAGTMLLGTALTIIVLLPNHNGHEVNLGLLGVDIVACVTLVLLAMFADRFWPLAMAMLQLDEVLIHGVKLATRVSMPFGYEVALAIWSYPMLACVAVGTLRHQRRLTHYGRDGAWTRMARQR